MLSNRDVYIYFSQFLIITVLQYFVIFHSDLFVSINSYQLKQFTPNIFIPFERKGIDDFVAILSGTINFIYIIVLPFFAMSFFTYKFNKSSDVLKERTVNLIYKQNWKYIIKVWFVFICVSFLIFWMIYVGIHIDRETHLTVQKPFTSTPQRYLFSAYFALNITYTAYWMLFFLLISPLFFNVKKEN